MDTERRRPDGNDVWAAATTDAVHLPAVRAPAELAVRPPPSPGTGLVEAGFGVAAVVVAVVERIAGTDGRGGARGSDVVLGLAWTGYRATARVTAVVSAAGAPAARLLADPPVVPRSIRPVTLANRAAAVWRQERTSAVRSAQTARDAVVPAALDVALAPVDLTRLVLDRVDLAAVVDRALDDLDLTEIVLGRVDLARVADAVLSQIDLTEVARDQVDLVSLAQEVIDAIDLPEIIRESTGSVASETVRAVRMQSIGADQGVQRIVDRVITWRRERNTQAPADSTDQGGSAPPDEAPSSTPGSGNDQ
ncbi:MAG: hypothetical protein OEV62_00825 [Actinomycetota bacterium]|nr:hypothetical protein [Actinomycetota bacterium]MDH5277616.1 hypothetical protein [Actinomycetota bacterium]